MTDVQQSESTKTRVRTRSKAEKPRRQPDEAKPADAGFIPFDDVVAELQQLNAQEEKNHWRQAELAYRVQPLYGDGTLAKLAKKNGNIAECTLRRRRNVYEAWFIKIRAAPPESFAVAQELQAHPDRANIIKRKPDITTREARQEMRDYNEKDKPKEPDSRLKQYEKWFKDAVNHANTVKTDAEIVDDLDQETRQILREAIEPKLLPDLLEGGNALIKLADFLQQLLDEATPT